MPIWDSGPFSTFREDHGVTRVVSCQVATHAAGCLRTGTHSALMAACKGSPPDSFGLHLKLPAESAVLGASAPPSWKVRRGHVGISSELKVLKVLRKYM